MTVFFLWVLRVAYTPDLYKYPGIENKMYGNGLQKIKMKESYLCDNIFSFTD